MTRKTVACYLAYNAAGVLEESLNSVIDLVDFVVSVDGAFLGMPVSEDYSSDGTEDIVKRIVGKKGLVLRPHRRLTEVQSRNLYAKFVQHKFQDAWMFTIDADEIVRDAEDDFEWLHGEDAREYQVVQMSSDDSDRHRMHGHHLYTSIFERTPFRPRFFGGIPGLHYGENHWTLRDAWGDRVGPQYRTRNLNEAWLEHMYNTRKNRNSDALGYYNIYQRWRYERMIRPLLSYLPYPLVRIAKRAFLRGNIQAERLLHFAHGYTLGSRTRD